jgi:4-hydroxybenzoate polyprenyltransferase
VILRLLYISRPVLWINTAGPATVGIWLAGDLWRWEVLPILLWLTLPFNLLIYGVNDVFDQGTDAQNPRKGTLEGARIDRAALGLMAWSAAKHTFDAVQDVDEDRKVGITTTAVRLGPGGVVLWSAAFWTLATVCFALVNVPVALVNAAIAGTLLYFLYRNPTPQTGHRLYKYSIAFPYVAGTVAGMQLVAALSLGAYP